MEEKIYYKICACCSKRLAEYNFRRLSVEEGRKCERHTWTSPVCKVCEKNNYTKQQRIEKLRALNARFRKNTERRLHKELEQRLLEEDKELGLVVWDMKVKKA